MAYPKTVREAAQRLRAIDAWIEEHDISDRAKQKAKAAELKDRIVKLETDREEIRKRAIKTNGKSLFLQSLTDSEKLEQWQVQAELAEVSEKILINKRARDKAFHRSRQDRFVILGMFCRNPIPMSHQLGAADSLSKAWGQMMKNLTPAEKRKLRSR